MPEESHPTAEDLRSRLTAEQYRVTQQCGTEAPFENRYWDCHEDGTYRCVVCEAPLFSSETKFDSGTGWPSFWEVMDSGAVTTRDDHEYGMLRTEVLCASCGAHLGHVFPDGPHPTGVRYCINSSSLDLERDDQGTG